MATIVISNIDDNLFNMTIGVLSSDKPKVYIASVSTGGFVRVEQEGTENSDLFNPIFFSEIEVDGVVGASASETVSLLNAVIYADGAAAAPPIDLTPLITEVNDEGDETQALLKQIVDKPDTDLQPLIDKVGSEGDQTQALLQQIVDKPSVDLQPLIDEVNDEGDETQLLLEDIKANTEPMPPIARVHNNYTIAGVTPLNIPTGAISISVIKTSENGVVNISGDNGTDFPLEFIYENFTDGVNEQVSKLTAYIITATDAATTFKVHTTR